MILYRALMLLALPVLAWRAWRRGHLAARMGRAAWPEGAVWVHGASNGELTSARALIAALEGPVVVTCNNPTARTMVAGWALPGVTATLAPFDLPWVVARILRHAPRALVIVENELWPERILRAARTMPVIVVGARMSERSAARWRRLPLIRTMLGAVAFASAQDAASAERLVSLGLPPNRLGPVAVLKAAVPSDPRPLPDAPALRDRTLLAASTHEGEEGAILDAFAAQTRFSWLIMAPRHPARGMEVAALAAARGLVVARRAAGDPPGGQVYVADTLGEMGVWYRMSAATVIGGTFAPAGGHTPYEPAAFGSAILHGPHLANFADAFADLDQAGGATKVTPDTLAPVLDLMDPPAMVAIARVILPDASAAKEVIDLITDMTARARPADDV